MADDLRAYLAAVDKIAEDSERMADRLAREIEACGL